MTRSALSPKFKPEASRARDGIAMIYDIAGFSAFFNQPDIHKYMPRYLNHISKCLDICIYGGEQYWNPNEPELGPLRLLPVHRKFIGDGALYIWAPKDATQIRPDFIIPLANRLWNLQRYFENVTLACADEIPLMELPSAVKFGIARGTVFELSIEGSQTKEYIGICVNLASRLQKYCSGLNFIASARLDIPKSELEKHGYTKAVATCIKGFPKEIIVVDKNEYARLDTEVKSKLFLPFPEVIKKAVPAL
jgi:hypothetical protein